MARSARTHVRSVSTDRGLTYPGVVVDPRASLVSSTPRTKSYQTSSTGFPRGSRTSWPFPLTKYVRTPSLLASRMAPACLHPELRLASLIWSVKSSVSCRRNLSLSLVCLFLLGRADIRVSVWRKAANLSTYVMVSFQILSLCYYEICRIFSLI